MLLVLIAIAFARLAWQRFPPALAALFALLPAYLLRFSVGPIPLTMLEVFVLTLGAVWLVRSRQAAKDTLSRALHAPWRIPLAALAVALVLGVAVAPDPFAALGVLKAYFVEPALVLAMLLATFSANDWRRSCIFLLAGAGVLAVIALVQYATGLGIPAPWDVERRVTSVFDFPNAVGLFLAPIVAACLAILPTIRQKRDRLAALIVAVLGIAAILAAKTEAALVAIPAGLLLTLMLSRARLQTKRRSVLAALVVLLIALAVPASRDKLFLADFSGAVRRAQWSETLAMLADRPIFGAGLSGYPTALVPYHDPTLYEIFQYPHTIVLNLWTELGLLGLAAMLALAVILGRRALLERQNAAVLAASAALLTMTIHGLVDVPFFKNDLALLTVFFVGLLLAAPTLHRE